MASNLEKKILDVLKEKKEALKEDASGVVPTSQHVAPAYVDLGGAITDPHGQLPDYAKGINPGQASLPGMNPTPGVGTVTGDAAPFTPNKAVNEDEEKGEDEPDDEKDDEKPVNEDRTADDENGQQKAKYATAEKQGKVKGQKGDDEDDEDEDKKDIKEDIEALFAGEKLTAAFKKKATNIFETAVYARVNAILERETNRLVEEYNEAVEEIKEELSNQVDSYLNYVTEQWVADNQIALETGIKNELVEDFLQGLKQLFAENYIEVPADKVDVLESLAEKVEELEKSLNEQIETNVALKEENTALVKAKVLAESTKGLTEVQAEKLIQLAEGVEFKDSETFTESLKFLKENQIVSKPKKSQNLTEEVADKPFEVEPKGEMKSIINALKLTTR